MNRTSFLCAFLFFVLVLPAGIMGQAGVLHLIASIDNVNEDISQGCEKDYREALELFSAVAKDAGMAFSPKRISFNLEDVEAFLDNFQCGPNDLVVFFYSGHGVRYEDDGQEWPWPYLYYCERNPNNDPADCELDLDWVQEMLIEKEPRMTIVLSDSCNDVVDNPSANAGLSEDAGDPSDDAPSGGDRFSNLGLIQSFRGHIIASAASPGQAAEMDPSEGSFFAGQFFHFLLEALTSPNPSSWEQVLKQTKNQVRQMTGGKQTPQYCVNGRCG